MRVTTSGEDMNDSTSIYYCLHPLTPFCAKSIRIAIALVALRRPVW
jgi:hypothetical protein